MDYKGTQCKITRGTAVPLVMEITQLGDLTNGWDITFTMRDKITAEGNPICQYDNEDILSMVVSENRVTINLSEADTWKIPAGCKQVFIQLNLKKLVKVVATEIYALDVLPNLIKVEAEPR